MYSLLLLTILSFVISLALTPVIRQLARARGWYDKPDGVKKIHLLAVPRIGGVPVVVAYLSSYALWLALPLNAAQIAREHLDVILRLTPVAILMFVLGLLDDLGGLSPRFKLVFQIAIATVAYFAGVRIEILAGLDITGWFSLSLTVFWLLLCTNAFNLIDGMDGLAAGLGFLATAAILVTAFTQGNVPLALLTAPLAGALLGFLRFNAPPASIFLGDSGSLLIGFLLGCYSVIWSQKVATLFGLMAPVMAVSLPILDVALSVGRRFLRGQPIFQGDRGHIHHMLLKRGFSVRKAVLLLYAAASLMALLSLTQSLLANQLGSLVTLLFCAFVWLGIQSLGYVEFRVAYSSIRSGSLLGVVSAQIRLRSLEERLAQAETVNDCWFALQEEVSNLGFASVSAIIRGHRFSGEPLDFGNHWALEIPLEGADRVIVYGDFCHPPQLFDPAHLSATIRRVFSSRINTLVLPEVPAANPIQPPLSEPLRAESVLALQQHLGEVTRSGIALPTPSAQTSG